jgi:hypothetical protein
MIPRFDPIGSTNSSRGLETIDYAVTGGTSRWQRRCVWVVLAIGVAFNAHSDMREMLTSGLDYPFSLLVTVPISAHQTMSGCSGSRAAFDR